MKMPRIQKSIPIPPRRKIVRDGGWVKFVQALSIGDSFRTRYNQLSSAAYNAGVKLTQRNDGNGYVRYWRVS